MSTADRRPANRVINTTCTAPSCSKPAIARRLCTRHYQQAKKAGTLPPLKTPRFRLQRRLVRAGNGCLEWVGHTGRGGYGSISVDGKDVKTHRLAWTLANGPIPDGLYVLHRCDNPPCCDPSHLFLGTLAENNADRAAKGRSGNRWASR